MSPFLRHFFFLSLFVFLFLSSLSHAFGGDVRPLTLVVIGRGQITTPYILVIPSEGDYCFLGQLFCFLCSILPLPNDHKHNTALLFELSSLPKTIYLLSLFCSSSLPMAVLFACLLCFECCWLFKPVCVCLFFFMQWFI